MTDIDLPDAYEDPDHGLGPADEGPVFYASYNGECACGAEFSAGDLVQYVSGELTALDCCGEGDA